ncbi:MAG: tRNA lysidine(34) synthetase TilS [Gammaproteobacteria bacterium]
MDKFEDIVKQVLLKADRALPSSDSHKRKLIIAYSGGRDSSALAHALAGCDLDKRFTPIVAHVNHGLFDNSGDWETFCHRKATELGLDYSSHQVQERPGRGQSTEDWARKARYAWFKKITSFGDFVVTAHHLDDQLETFLLHLARGSGPHGLSAIRASQSFGNGFLIRPMLTIPKESINRYVAQHEIAFISDPSNANEQYDRNYLRHSVVPVLRKRWPKIAENVAHAAGVQQIIATELDNKASEILAAISGDTDGDVSLEALNNLSSGQRFWFFRHWCVRRHLGLPERRHILEIEKSIFSNAPKATLSITWKNAELNYYDGRLFLRRQPAEFNPATKYTWDLTAPLNLANGTLEPIESRGAGLDLRVRKSDCEVGFYQRIGERCHPHTRQHSQSLKKLFQQWRVPPWERQTFPIVWINGDIAAVVPFCYSRKFAAPEGARGLSFNFVKHSS